MMINDKALILYRVNKGGKVIPGQTKSYARGNTKPTKAVFLTNNPQQVANNHGIIPSSGKHGYGNLNAYKVHPSIKKQKGVVVDIYDRAWEIFIPIDIWQKFVKKNMIKYLGSSKKSIQKSSHYAFVARSREMQRHTDWLFKDVEANIDHIKEFVSKKFPKPTNAWLMVSDYYESQGRLINVIFDHSDRLEFIFKKFGITFLKRLSFKD